MNKYLILISIILLTAQKALCAAEVASPELSHSLKNNTHEPGFGSIVFALIVVISLIYITGLIYSKLNIVGAKTVQEQLRNYDLSKVVVVSTTQLGQGKNLHVIELNNQRYLIGATINSINLIKELGEAKREIKRVEPSNVEVFDTPPEPEDNFDVHKKYL